MIYFIINPVAGGGRAARLWPRYRFVLEAAFPGQCDFHLTSGPKSASQLAQKLANSGARRIVSVGGDGTHHQVVNGLYAALGQKKLAEVTYALLPLGSGNDWIRTHDIPRQITEWIEMYRKDVVHRQNLGLIEYRDSAGNPHSRIFTNVAGVAYDAFVVERTDRLRCKSRWIYPLLTLWYLRHFEPPRLRLSYDGKTVERRFHTINIGIGRYSGGGMQLVPQADSVGRTFALTYAPAFSVAKIIANGWRFYTTTVGRTKGVVTTQANDITIEAAKLGSDLRIEADGELLGWGPLRFELLPAALSFVAPPKKEPRQP